MLITTNLTCYLNEIVKCVTLKYFKANCVKCGNNSNDAQNTEMICRRKQLKSRRFMTFLVHWREKTHETRQNKKKRVVGGEGGERSISLDIDMIRSDRRGGFTCKQKSISTASRIGNQKRDVYSTNKTSMWLKLSLALPSFRLINV